VAATCSARQEGLDAEALLRAVRRPQRRAGAAGGAAGAVRGRRGLRHPRPRGTARRNHRSGWWRASTPVPTRACGPARPLLAELRALQARGATALDLLREADARTGYAAVLANLPNAARRLADWQGVLELVARSRTGSADAFALARRLGRLRAAGVEVPRPPLRSSDAVALMSIHGAKGLEWPVVAVADLARPARAARATRSRSTPTWA
jgi:superfamily I DNA/RNA helicase